MAKNKKEPEVISFEEPRYNRGKRGKEALRERDRFLSGDVSQIFSSFPEEEVRTSAEPSTSQLDLKATLREVQSLAASSFTGKTKRKFEEDQIRALGAKPPTPDCVPYPHYQAVVKARREKEKRAAEELKASGGRKKQQQQRGRSIVKGKGRWKESTKSLEPGIGKFKNGVLTLNKRDLAKIK